MHFINELDFERALINALKEHGRKGEVLKNPTEEDLLDNWAQILFENNRGIDRLNNCPLTKGEMAQIMEQIVNLKTPVKLNSFINGKTVAIKRDNPNDPDHFGKEVSLKIYDRREIAAGDSRYQIVEQPNYSKKIPEAYNRRGDLTLLINGMPVIHIELKRTGVSLSEAYEQIRKYSHEGVFTGLYSLIQIFVIMTPEETRYFANPGPEGDFNRGYCFHRADEDNEPINDWERVVSSLLSIPMAHQLIGFYTVADEADGILKVMRSYQYYAATKISDTVAKHIWDEGKQRGGYIWHTTGSGKTLTSFKAAQLIADSKDADKVVFLMDRIELGTQSLDEYRGFAGEQKGTSNEESLVKGTDDTYALLQRLKSENYSDTLIVTSIQKMGRLSKDTDSKAADLKRIRKKRVVFIIDEAHRSTFGDMLINIKKTFPNALFFGFTGTPIYEVNNKDSITTPMIFGNELHRYSIADGIRDGNVLGFDLYQVLPVSDSELREKFGLDQSRSNTVEEALADYNGKKAKIYKKIIDPNQTDILTIENQVPNSRYQEPSYQESVVKDIIARFPSLSRGGLFHAIFACSSIKEAIDYYRIFKKLASNLKVTSLFDPNIDNNENFEYKEDGLLEIIRDYNDLYGKSYSLSNHRAFKKDLSNRLAHKGPYRIIDKKREECLDILIVVDQMLTGFDSKFVNTLYLDKVLEYENIIQAFSRTNRVYKRDEKPFGIIRYYRRPHLMENNINAALKLYSGDRVPGLFVDKLDKNIDKMNYLFNEIEDVFEAEGIYDFSRLPDTREVVAKFVSLYNQLYQTVQAAKIQDFSRDREDYEIEGKTYHLVLNFDEKIYNILGQRYSEVVIEDGDPGSGPGINDICFDLNPQIIEAHNSLINTEYMNQNFAKYLKLRTMDEASLDEIERALKTLHSSFASLNQEEQKYANILIHDIESGDLIPEEGKTFRDYITDYLYQASNDKLRKFSDTFGLDEGLLRSMAEKNLNENNINDFGQLDDLKKSADMKKTKEYFEKKEGKQIFSVKVHAKLDEVLRKFLYSGGEDFDY